MWNPFKPKLPTRNIFVYWDGDAERRIDPLKAYRDLYNHDEFRMDIHPVAAEEGDDDALTIFLSAMREVFGLKEYDASTDTGLPIAETCTLFVDFCDYIENLKKNTEHFATSQPATESTSPESNGKSRNGTPRSGSVSTAP